MCIKVIYSWSFRCSAKETVLLLLSWSTLYVAISKCIASWFFSYLNLLQLIQSACVKVNFPLNFRCSTKEAAILLLSWSNLYIAFARCIGSWFCFVLFWFAIIHPKCMCKSHFFKNFRCSAQEAVMWSTLYIAFLKWKVSWF